jgi:uncharacterized protein YjiS (DUF1127 family)
MRASIQLMIDRDAVRERNGFISGGLGLYKTFRWLQEERLRIATIRELDRLNDDYLHDIGVKRKDIRPIVNAW